LNRFLVARADSLIVYREASCFDALHRKTAGNRNIRDESKRWQIKRDVLAPIIVMVHVRPNK
jgi:hypothetical protein